MRTFLLALVAFGLVAACENMSRPATPPNRIEEPAIQQDPSPLVLAAGWLGRLGPSGLELTALADGATRTLPLESPVGVGRLADGSLAVLDRPAKLAGNTRLQVLRPGAAEPEVATGFLMAGGAVRAAVLPATGGDDLLVAARGSNGSLTRLVRQADKFTANAVTPLTNDEARAATAQGGVALVAGSDGWIRVGADGQATPVPLPAGAHPLTQLAAGGPGQIWVGIAGRSLALLDAAGAVVVAPAALDGTLVALAADEVQAYAVVARRVPGGAEVAWTLEARTPSGPAWSRPLPGNAPAAAAIAAGEGEVAVLVGATLSRFGRDGAARGAAR